MDLKAPTDHIKMLPFILFRWNKGGMAIRKTALSFTKDAQQMWANLYEQKELPVINMFLNL